MKGLEPLQWAFITLTITMLIVVFASNPLQVAIEEAIANSAELTAERLRSAINFMQTMPGDVPDGTTHKVKILAKTCKIRIDERSVTVEIKRNTTLSIIQTGNVIEPKDFDCSVRAITIKKIGNIIKFV